ncbi:MAG: hypothetical protein ABGX83_06070 [Nitrospira sp.]|nr:hypothetical protein [Candidatus Manganitrophaceae bacterium]HIL34942.1 hypothetical protein [Candidatus Manganitrophaceae bacterium]
MSSRKEKFKRMLTTLAMLPVALLMTQCAESFDPPVSPPAHNQKAFIASGGLPGLNPGDPPLESPTVAIITGDGAPEVIGTLSPGGSNDVAATFGHVYVNNSGADSVGVIDANSNTVIKQIGVGARPIHSKVIKGGNLLIVGNDGPSGRDPANDPLLVAQDDSISIIDTNPNNASFLLEIARIRVGDGHHIVAYSDVANRVAVTNLSAGTTSIVDINLLQTICTVPVGIVPHGIDYSDVSGHAYVANVVGPTEAITIINLDGSIPTIPTDPHTPTTAASTCSVDLDLGGITKGSAAGQIPASGFTHTNHAGTFVYTVGYDSATTTGYLSVIDTSTDTVPAGGVIQIANLQVTNFKPDKFAITENDGRIYVSSVDSVNDTDPNNPIFLHPGNTVAVFDINTVTGIPALHATTPFITVGPGHDHRALKLSSDGTRLFVPNSGSDNVSIIDTATLSVISTLEVGHEPNSLIYVDPETLEIPATGGGAGGHGHAG